MRGGAALVAQAYAPIAREARSAQLRVGIVLQALLLGLLLVFVPLLARVTRRIRDQIAHIRFQAYFDQLTRLPNRTHLFQRVDAEVARARELGHLLAVLVVDLDRFRDINDTLGHDAGDEVLVDIARRLRTLAGERLFLARLGGDELVLAGTFDGKEAAKAFAEDVRAALEPPITIDGMPLVVDGSVGIAFAPVDGEDADSLVKHAEVAAQTAKALHRGVLAYSPAVDSKPSPTGSTPCAGCCRRARSSRSRNGRARSGT